MDSIFSNWIISFLDKRRSPNMRYKSDPKTGMTAIKSQVTLFSGGVFRLTIAKIVDTYKSPMTATDSQCGNHLLSQKKAAKDAQSSKPINKILNPYLDINRRNFRKVTASSFFLSTSIPILFTRCNDQLNLLLDKQKEIEDTSSTSTGSLLRPLLLGQNNNPLIILCLLQIF